MSQRVAERAPGRRHTYLLRMWQESDASSWRLIVQDVKTDERWGFTDIHEFVYFLKNTINQYEFVENETTQSL